MTIVYAICAVSLILLAYCFVLMKRGEDLDNQPAPQEITTEKKED